MPLFSKLEPKPSPTLTITSAIRLTSKPNHAIRPPSPNQMTSPRDDLSTNSPATITSFSKPNHSADPPPLSKNNSSTNVLAITTNLSKDIGTNMLNVDGNIF